MRTIHAATALGLYAILALTACQKPAEPQASNSPSPANAVATEPPASAPAEVGATASSEPPKSRLGQLLQAPTTGSWRLALNTDSYAGTPPEGVNEVYTDASSYMILGPHQVAIAQKITNKSVAADGEAYTIWAIAYDCRQHTSVAMAYARYDAADKRLGSASFKPSELKVVAAEEGTVGYAVFHPFCTTLGLS